MKHCNGCGESKPLDQFHRHACMPDGVQSKCKPCMCALVHRSYERRKLRDAAYILPNVYALEPVPPLGQLFAELDTWMAA